jgi:hypothetical protein
MPYKASGNWVYVKKSGKWKRHKRHPNALAANKHVRALNAWVGHGHKRIVKRR